MAATYTSLIGISVGGKYEIRRILGAGGMGVVCEALHVDLGKRVAIKLIDKSMKESELIVARFKREARAAGQIDSDHIVDVFDVGADPRVGLYMVMEYLTGEDLQDRLERDKRIDTRTAVMIGHQITRALAKAHAAGVIHRDLKPANVYLTQRDNGQLHVKLLDFGVSKLVSEVPGEARITGQGSPIGTPLYMAPEQAEGKDDVDGRADIWSLGALLYEALAGDSAFQDRGSYHNTLVGILTTRPKPLRDVAPWVPEKLAAVVDAMLVHDRDARIPDAAAVTQRLLDCFPTVLPDGTGRHSAVIVPQSDAAADATSDTEVFTQKDMKDAAAARGSKSPKAQDSTTTMGDYATPVPGPLPGGFPKALPSSRPKTMPLPPNSSAAASFAPAAPTSSSSSRFETMKLTPSEILPLPSVAPPKPENASKRSAMTIASVLLAIVGIGVGAYLAGHRSQAPITTPAPAPTAKMPAPVFTDVSPAPTVPTPTLPEGPATTAPPAPSVASVAPPVTNAPGLRYRPIHKLKIKPSQTPSPEPPAAPEPEPPPTTNPATL